MKAMRKLCVLALFGILVGVNFAAVVNWNENNKQNDTVHILVLDGYGDPNGDFKLKKHSDGTYDLLVWTDSGAELEIFGLIEPPNDLVVSMDLSPNDPAVEYIVYVDSVEMDHAKITVPRTGPVHGIFHTEDMDTFHFRGRDWQPTYLLFDEKEGSVTFEVEHFSAYGVAEGDTTYTVTTTEDSGDGSLRRAINDANTNLGLDKIVFDMPSDDPGHYYYVNDGTSGHVTFSNRQTTTASSDSMIEDIDPDHPHSWWSIQPASGLPPVTDPVIIDGYTQQGAEVNIRVGDNSALLRIELDGTAAGLPPGGLQLSSSGSTVRGLAIMGFSLCGVQIDTGGYNTIQGNFIGTDISGLLGSGNFIGVNIFNSSGNLIGGELPASSNIISGNRLIAVLISGDLSRDNTVSGNHIGNQGTQKAASGNGASGIWLSESIAASNQVRKNQNMNNLRTQSAKELVFFDTSVDNYLSLVKPLLDRENPETDDFRAGYELVILDRRGNGIADITDKLALYSEVAAVHIFSHGEPGSFQLGTTHLSATTIDSYTEKLGSWGNALSDDADILLYGCSVAMGPNGMNLLNRIGELTGADIAASDDATGSEELGGDWELEVTTGNIQAVTPIPDSVLVDYTSILGYDIIVDTPLATYIASPTVTPYAKTSFVNGLGEVAVILTDATDENGELDSSLLSAVPGILNTTVPDDPSFVGLSNLLEEVSLGTLFQGTVVDQIDLNYTAGTSLAGFATFLDGLDTTVGSLDITVDVLNSNLNHISGDEYELWFKIRYTIKQTNTQTHTFDIGRNGDLFGLTTDLGTMPDAELELGFMFNLTFGTVLTITEGNFSADWAINDTKVETANSNFFVRNTALSANANIDESDLDDFDLLVGFLEISVEDATFVLDADMTALLMDPDNSDGKNRITLSEMTSTSINTLVEVQTAGYYSAVLPVSVTNIPSTSFSSVFSGLALYINLTGDPFDPFVAPSGDDDPRTTSIIVFSPDFREFLLVFNNILPDGVMGLLDQLKGWLGTFGVSQIFSAVGVPFADGKTLADVMDFFSGLQTLMGDPSISFTDDDGITIPLFISFQEFAQDLDSALDISIGDIDPHFDRERKQLFFTIEVDPTLPPLVEIPIDFDVDLGDLGNIETNVMVNLTPTVDISLTIGIDISSLIEVSVNSKLTDFALRALINSSSGQSFTPADGQLTDNARFKLSIGTLGTISVNISAGNTSDNSNISDLADDIQEAINNELSEENIDAVINVEVLTGNRLALFTTNTTFMKITNNSVDDAESKGGFELLGFWNGQVGSTTPTPLNGVLSGDATFDLVLGTTLYHVFLDQANTTNNANVGEPTEKGPKINRLVTDIRSAIDDTIGTSGEVDVTQMGDGFAITLGTTPEKFIQVFNPNDVAFYELGVPKNYIAAEIQILGERYLFIEGGYLSGTVASDGLLREDAFIDLEVDGEPVSVTVHAANFKLIGFTCNQYVTGNMTAPNNVTDITGYAPGADITCKLWIDGDPYVVTVPKSATDSNLVMTHLLYDINTAFETATAENGTTVDITSLVTAVADPSGKKVRFTPANLSHTLLITNMGTTHDNDDLQDLASDISGAIAREKLSDGTPLDRVINVGIYGYDTNDDDVNDEFSLALSIPSALKDTLAITDTGGDLVFSVTSTTVYGPRANGRLNSDATFTLSLDEGTGLVDYDIEVDFTQTTSNNNISDLVEDINLAMTTATSLNGTEDITDKIVAGLRGNRITFSVTNKDAKQLKVTDTNSYAEQELGLTDGVTAQAREKRGRLFIQDVSLSAGMNLVVSPSSRPAAEAHFGFVGIEVDEIKGVLSGYGTDVAVHGDVSVTLGGIKSTFELTTFKITQDANIGMSFDGKNYPVTLPKGLTTFNNDIDDLAEDLWKAINDTSTDLIGKVVVGTNGDRLTISATGGERLRLTVDDSDPAATVLGFATGQQVGPIYLNDLSDAVGDTDILNALVHLDISGSGSLLLANISLQLPDLVEGLINELGINPSIYINLTDFTNMSTLSINPLGLGAISDGFDDLNFSSVIDALQSILQLLLQFSMFDFLDEPLPILGITLNETLEYIQEFYDFLDDLENNPAAIVQDLDALLKEALGLPSDSDLVGLSLDTNGADILRINFSYSINYSASLPVQIDLLNLLGISLPSGLEDLANLSGAAGLEAEFSATITLGLGIDLADFTLYIYDNTGIRLEGYAAGTNVNFVAALGPFGLFITGGNAVFNEDGDPNSTSPAYFQLAAFDDPDDIPNGDKVELTNFDIQAELSAGIGAILPCYFPTASNFIGNLDFDISIDIDISDPKLLDVTANLNSAPDFTSLPDLGDFNLIESLLLVVEGLDLVLAIIGNVMSGEFGSISIPLIGDSLKDAADFIEDIRSNIIPKLRDFIENAPQKAIELVQKAIYSALGPPGLDVLQLDANWDNDPALSYKDVQYTFPDNMTELQFNLWLGSTYSWETPEIDFGLPGLGLEMDGGILVAFDWHLLVCFGISMDDGFYLDTTPWDEFTDHLNGTPNPPQVNGEDLENITYISLSVGLPESITGKLLFLQLDIENRDVTMEDPDKKSLIGYFSVNLEGGGANERLSFSEIPSMDLDFSWGVEADIDLDLKLGIVGGGAWPSVVSEFYLRWGLGDSVDNSSSDPLENHYAIPWIGFYNIGLNLGSFFSDFLGPIIEVIQTVTKPLQPLVDILTAPIPVISDLAGEDITLIDIAGMFGVVDPSFIYAIADLITLINSIPTDAGDIVIIFGDFTVGGDGTLDLRDENALSLIRKSPSSASLSDIIRDNFGDSFGDLADVIDGFDFGGSLDSAMSGSSASQATKGFASSTTKEGGGFSFPLFQDAGQIFGLIMGRPADIIVYDMPKFIFDFTYSQFFPIWDGLGAEITGSIGVIIDLSFGYDTYGIQEFAAGGFKHPLDLFKGFYIGDLDLTTGADIPEVTIYGSLTGAAVLNIVVAKVGVGGGIYATIDFNLNDPDGDGKIRIEELWGNIVNGFKQLGIPLGLICIFDVSGRVEARLFAFVELLWGLWEKTWYFGPALPLIEFSYTCPHDPILAKMDEDTGVLRLNMGEFAQDRLYGDTTDGPEEFHVKLKSGNTVEVWAPRLGVSEGEAQEHSGVTKIMAKAGNGNDIIDLSRVGSGSITAELLGESGNDVLIAGTGAAKFYGGLGDDVLVGGNGADELYGDKGNDKLIGNGGSDFLDGGDQDDELNGDAQPSTGASYTLRGTQGNDIVLAGEGDDILAGGGGEDVLRGGGGKDWIWGDSSLQFQEADYVFQLITNGGGKPDLDPDDPSIGAEDHITGDADADNISGEGGSDIISGGGAPDRIFGGGGPDRIWGDSNLKFSDTYVLEFNTSGGPVTIFPLYGTAAGDNITGGDGDDTIYGEDGNDELHGGADEDLILGNRGSDIIYGDEDDDDLYGGTGNDRMFGNHGDDLVKGEADNDVLFGDDGEIYIVSGQLTLNYEFITTVNPTTAGDDTMNGDVGDDILLGGPGGDIMNGGDGHDKLVGDNGEFTFTFFSSMGGSLLDLFESVDPGDGGEDTIYGGEGDDIIIGGAENDIIYGDADVMGTDGNDVAMGDNGRVDFVPDPDTRSTHIKLIETTDTSDATGGDDTIDGSENDDILLGGVGADDITGGLDDDIILGDSGKLDYDTGDGDLSTLDLILTTDNILPAPGGVDDLSGGEADDIIIGGKEGDNIWGDDTLGGSPSGDPGEDIVIGDQGELVFENGLVATITATDKAATDGGADTIEGNEEKDILIGGVGGDYMYGSTGDDIMVGDEGLLKYNLALGSGGDGDAATLDMINTTKPDLGDGDEIQGDDGEDIILGGAGGDEIWGNNDDDVILGDNGELTMPGEVIDMIETIFPSYGDSDTIEGNDDDDIILGGTAGDDIWGHTGQDIILGDNGRLTMPDEVIELVETTDPSIGGSDTIEGNDGDDMILGGAEGDDIWGHTGRDMILGDNGKVTMPDEVVEQIETTDPAIGGSDTIEGNEGDDYILGGAEGDDIWGHTGDDVILGDNGKLDFVVDADAGTLDLIETTDPAIGGVDTIEGNEDPDTILGGAFGDDIWGHEGDDTILGDNGRITQPGEIVERIETTDPAIGGSDTIEGNEGADYIFGGAAGDYIWGNDADDVILGDNGFLDFVFDGDASSLDLIVSTDPVIGGSDTIEGNDGDDKILGGADGDDIWGHTGEDIILGDNGNITQPGEEVEWIRTTDPAIGGSDTIEGNEQDDIILGGAFGDHLEGNSHRDIILGDNGWLDYVLTSVDATEPDTSTLDLIIATFPNDGGSDMILGGSENDIAFGGTADDTIYGNQGNDLLFGDHARVERKPFMELNLSTLPVPTFYFLAIYTAAADGGDGDLIHGNEGDDILLGQQADDDMFGDEDDDDLIGGHNVVGGIDELDVGPDLNDMMDGGSEDDVLAGDNAIILRRYDTITPRIRALNGDTLYDDSDDADVDGTHQSNPSGARGRDITMLDHSDSPTPYTYGNDYMAGGPHEDVMFGQLGDDFMQGDASVAEFISPTDPSVEGVDDGDDYMEGNGGRDLIFGNYGQDDIIGGSSELFGLTAPNLRPDDSDTIFGGAGTRVARNDPGDESDDGHALDSDYILGDNGNIYRIVGTKGVDSGDFLAFTYDNYGNVTIVPRSVQKLDYTEGGDPGDIGEDDLIHGEAGDDLIEAEKGNDVAFGEGQDDDIYGQTGHDRIYGGTGQDGIMGDDGKIRTSRNNYKETLWGVKNPYKEKFIKMPGPFIGAWVDIEERLKKVADTAAFFSGGNDILYGGLGDDWMHGGAGDDAMLGAEALVDFYNSDPVTNTTPIPYDNLTGKLFFYDADNPRVKIAGFFLNFDAVDESGVKINDGKDRLFGDPGHDWLVGGTENDRHFGGLGDDVINADDNHDSQGGLNNEPDDPEFADSDFSFGGAGRDVLIFNTGGDRSFDWTGEFNSYIAPYSPFGEPETDRLTSPHVVKFLMNLGEACGADQALIESDGELGLADQKDDRWGDQHGGPRDPQAGNLPGVHRDTQGEPEDDR